MNTLDIDKENIKGIGITSGSVTWSVGFNGGELEILEIDLTDENGEEVDAGDLFKDEVLLKSLEDKVFDMIDQTELDSACNPLENTHDYTHLVSANIKWLTSYLALSESRTEQVVLHNEVREVIEKLNRAFESRTDESMLEVQEAFEWLGKNIWKLWC